MTSTLAPEALADWLLLATFERLRFASGSGWEYLPPSLDLDDFDDDEDLPWTPLRNPLTWITASAWRLTDSEDVAVRLALKDRRTVLAALEIVKSSRLVAVVDPVNVEAPVRLPVAADVVDLSAFRSRRAS